MNYQSLLKQAQSMQKKMMETQKYNKEKKMKGHKKIYD